MTARSLYRTLATATMATGLALTTALPAQAKEAVVEDGAHDVLRFTSADNFSTGTPAPEMSNGDILKSRFRHGSHRVLVRVQFADLARQGQIRGDFLEIRTNTGMRASISIVAGRGDWAGQVDAVRGNGHQLRCHVSHAIDYTFDFVRIGVPRSCLGNPRTVRLGVGSVTVQPNLDSIYADDAQLTGQVRDDITLTRPLPRG